MYYLPEPPYFLLVFGLFAGITCGLAFESVLKQTVKQWSKRNYSSSKQPLQQVTLLLPFWGICAGVCVFLASGLAIFNIDLWIAYGISLPLTIMIAGLIWSQLAKLLQILQQGGSQALDLDMFN
jgi:protein-S-isoprenylcysteine O-methyltransferase Ste14